MIDAEMDDYCNSLNFKYENNYHSHDLIYGLDLLKEQMSKNHEITACEKYRLYEQEMQCSKVLLSKGIKYNTYDAFLEKEPKPDKTACVYVEFLKKEEVRIKKEKLEQERLERALDYEYNNKIKKEMLVQNIISFSVCAALSNLGPNAGAKMFIAGVPMMLISLLPPTETMLMNTVSGMLGTIVGTAIYEFRNRVKYE